MKKTNYDYTLEYMLLFRRIIRAYEEHMARTLGDPKLTPNEIATLSLVDGKTTASAIARRNEVSKALVSRSVKLLLDGGYVTMAPSQVDKREYILSLTETGEMMKNKIAAEGECFASKTLRELDDDRKNVLRALLLLILRNDGGE